MSVKVDIEGGQLILSVEGIDKLFTFTGSISVPLEHVSSVCKAPEISRKDIGLKIVGAGVPGLIRAGRYSGKDGLAFWDVRDYDKALMFELHDERYARLFVQVEDPEGTLSWINDELTKAKETELQKV